MSEDVKKEEVIDEGEVVEIETETQEPESEEAEQSEEEVATRKLLRSCSETY